MVHEEWIQALQKLDAWLQEQKTANHSYTAIIKGLQEWSMAEPNLVNTGSVATVAQAQLGWGLAIEGCISKHWQEE